MFRPFIAVSVVSATFLFFTQPAIANEIDVTGSLAAGASNRSDDGVGSASLRLRYAWLPNVAVGLSLIAAAGETDERSIGAMALTAQLGKTFGRWRPAIRAGIVHQHETAIEDLEENPFTVTLGVDEAIRHRTGGTAELGVTVDLYTHRHGVAFASSDLTTQVMFDNNGPRAYILLGLGLGVRVGAL